MLKKVLTLLFFLVVINNVYAASTTQAPTILIVGDSLSAGYGIDIKKGWVELLRQRLISKGYRYSVVNASISGDTTSNGLLRLPVALDKYQPQIVIVQLGANDGLRGISLKTIQNNLTRMIDLSQQKNAEILLLGLRLPPNFGAPYTEGFHNIYLQLARQNNLALVPFFLAGVDDQMNLIQQDRLHPNEKAQSILLNNVWKELQPMLKKN